MQSIRTIYLSTFLLYDEVLVESGKIMPPKATWFEPKLRSGLVIHELG